ncbi:sensor histidine kinase [Costertonia aggregata]|uniref:histidine kinase n=1 Tax=Costertonia aggregata TaxID=343403 RepID=A0A7H9AT43_9FLAO|nr:sensor histidine kinase [Costertonia aggregata]QLG46365.1 sensor histidine kinase [Costertonia aggregata]
MHKSATDEYRLNDKIKLTHRVNYFTSALSIILGIVCYFVLDIKEIIPFLFMGFGVVNFINILSFKSHKNLTITYNVSSVLSLGTALAITLYSGGINSPFIFILALIVFAAYVTTRVYGRIYLYLNLVIVVLLFLESLADYQFTHNVVPEASRNLFAFISVFFTVYILGGVLGKNLMQVHHKLYRSRNEIQQRIEEKETLLKEIHHRVKNNLQTVSSLLSLQSRNITNEKVKNLIKSSQNRVISMAMVHEMLYMREDLSKIEYRSYVKELSEYLIRSVKGAENNVKLDLDIPDIKLRIDTAIPLGLLINEAITNALKYGITDDKEGIIHIALKKADENEYILDIGDNGIGFSEPVDLKNTKTLGLKLINNLARQLNGSISRDTNKKGTNYIVKFKEAGSSEIPVVA